MERKERSIDTELISVTMDSWLRRVEVCSSQRVGESRFFFPIVSGDVLQFAKIIKAVLQLEVIRKAKTAIPFFRAVRRKCVARHKLPFALSRSG